MLLPMRAEGDYSRSVIFDFNCWALSNSITFEIMPFGDFFISTDEIAFMMFLDCSSFALI